MYMCMYSLVFSCLFTCVMHPVPVHVHTIITYRIKAKPHIDFVKKAFGASNPAVRTAAINVVGVMHLYLGAQVTVFFEEEKPALKQQIDDAIAKVTVCSKSTQKTCTLMFIDVSRFSYELEFIIVYFFCL